jgi:hypothetical protein
MKSLATHPFTRSCITVRNAIGTFTHSQLAMRSNLRAFATRFDLAMNNSFRMVTTGPSVATGLHTGRARLVIWNVSSSGTLKIREVRPSTTNPHSVHMKT